MTVSFSSVDELTDARGAQTGRPQRPFVPVLNRSNADIDPAWLEPTWIITDGEDRRPDGPLSPLGQQTASALPTLDWSSHAANSLPPVRMIDEEHPETEPATYALLRSRLTAAAWLLLVGLSLLFLYQFARYELTPRSLGAGTLVVMIGCAVLLSGHRVMDARQLRLLELSIFGIAGIQLISTHLDWLSRAAAARDIGDFSWAACVGTMAFGVLILSYGMLMPNGWRRTATMLVLPAVAPIAAIVFIRSWDRFAAETLSLGRLCELSAYMVGAWGVAVFGTWTISTLRQEYRRALRFGQYRLKQRIGHGGMGEVYLAEHRLLKRPCAIKLIRSNQVSDPQSLVRFEKEVRSTARLSHWNTVEIYDYGHTDDGTFYYVMEYLPGLNLAELVQRFGVMSPERVIHFLMQTCDALLEAHAVGLIHRDLKPANIFAAYRGGLYDVTKLLDFGLVVDDARGEHLLTCDAKKVSLFAGSPLYMAPEQASGDLPPDPRGDLYSLGATAYCLLTGHPPFEGKSPLRLMIAHARDPVTPPSRLEPGVPRDLELVILRCLEKHPSRRFANVRELRDALARCAATGKWTQERAAQWWRLRAPSLLAASAREQKSDADLHAPARS